MVVFALHRGAILLARQFATANARPDGLRSYLWHRAPAGSVLLTPSFRFIHQPLLSKLAIAGEAAIDWPIVIERLVCDSSTISLLADSGGGAFVAMLGLIILPFSLTGLLLKLASWLYTFRDSVRSEIQCVLSERLARPATGTGPHLALAGFLWPVEPRAAQTFINHEVPGRPTWLFGSDRVCARCRHTEAVYWLVEFDQGPWLTHRSPTANDGSTPTSSGDGSRIEQRLPHLVD